MLTCEAKEGIRTLIQLVRGLDVERLGHASRHIVTPETVHVGRRRRVDVVREIAAWAAFGWERERSVVKLCKFHCMQTHRRDSLTAFNLKSLKPFETSKFERTAQWAASTVFIRQPHRIISLNSLNSLNEQSDWTVFIEQFNWIASLNGLTEQSHWTIS